MQSNETVSGQSKEQSIEAVRQGLKNFENYVNSHDTDNLMKLYFDDVKYMQHGLETIQGIDKLKQQFIAMFEASSGISVSVQEIDASGDMVYVHILTYVTLKANTQKVILRVFEVWRRHADGSWKISRVSVNNPPAPAAS